MLGALLGLLIVGVVGIVAVIATLAVLGMVFSMVFGGITFMFFKVLPLLLIGWVVVKLVGSGACGRPRSRISAADQRWLDEG